MIPDRRLLGVSGVYMIRNKVNWKMYIGASKNLYKRCVCQASVFRKRKTRSMNAFLMADMVLYGLESFEFLVVEFCEPKDLLSREYFWINDIGTVNREIGYNLRRDGPNGMIAAPSTTEKISRTIQRQWDEGARDRVGTGKLLSERWKAMSPDCRSKVCAMISQLKTEWRYTVTFPSGVVETCNYSRLLELRIHKCMAGFYRSKSNHSTYKGHVVLRTRL